jgi:DNA-binding MarR family transcriptional regulator
MAFDALVTNPGRLRILTALAVEPHVEFVRLRALTELSDGNLSCHARRLASAGLVGIDKAIEHGKPVTRLMLTPDGRAALETHVRRLMSALSHRRIGQAASHPRQTALPPEQQAGRIDLGRPAARPRTGQAGQIRAEIAPVKSEPHPTEVAAAESAADDWID